MKIRHFSRGAKPRRVLDLKTACNAGSRVSSGSIGTVEGQDPPQYVGYPRPQLQLDPSKLEMLRDAYYGSSWLMAATLGLAVIVQGAGLLLLRSGGDVAQALGTVILVGAVLPIFAVDLLVAFRYSSMVARATDKGTGYAVCLALGAAVLSPCCCGILGCMVIRHSVPQEYKRYGIEVSFFGGVKKAVIQAKIDQLKEAQAAPAPTLQ